MHSLDTGAAPSGKVARATVPPIARREAAPAPVLRLVDGHDPSPADLIAAAEAMVDGDVPRDEAAAKLAALTPDRGTLDAAHHQWTDRMHHGRSGDLRAGAVLRVILAALAELPRPPAVVGAR